MEVFKKNVFIAKKYLNVPFSNTAPFLEPKKVIVIKVGLNDYRELVDLWSADNGRNTKFMILRSPMPHYSLNKYDGEYFIDDLIPYFKDLRDKREKIDFTTLMIRTNNDLELK